MYMGGCQTDGPLLDPLNTRCRIILQIGVEAFAGNGSPWRLHLHFLRKAMSRSPDQGTFLQAPTAGILGTLQHVLETLTFTNVDFLGENTNNIVGGDLSLRLRSSSCNS